MAVSSIPEEIKQYRPGPCTEVKLINGHYYVYMYQSVRLPSGRWGKKTGKSIGTIIPGTGFIPNRNYYLYKGEGSQDVVRRIKGGINGRFFFRFLRYDHEILLAAARSKSHRLHTYSTAF